MAEKLTFRVKNIAKSNKYCILRPDWIKRCIENQELVDWKEQDFLTEFIGLDEFIERREETLAKKQKIDCADWILYQVWLGSQVRKPKIKLPAIKSFRNLFYPKTPLVLFFELNIKGFLPC